MSKVMLTKKLSPANTALLESVNGVEIISVPEGDTAAYKNGLLQADAVLMSTAFKMTAEDIETASNLKVVSRTGVGVDNVDIAAASKKGIMVLNTPAANTISVAEHAVSMVAAISKQLLYYDSQVRKNNYKVRRQNLCVDIEGKTLGLIGCGKIGQAVAAKCVAAFNMKVIGYDPFIPSLDGIEMFKDIKDVLSRADYVSLHLPLNDDTRGLIDNLMLSIMKPTAYIINTSRGGIVDENALADALNSGKLAGAALDVLSTEPPAQDNPLLTCEKIILTPHSAALTNECTERVANEAIQGIVDWLKGNDPKNIFNKNTLKLGGK